MTAAVNAPVSTRRERWSWYLYDFGNSAYAAVVLLAGHLSVLARVLAAQGGTREPGAAADPRGGQLRLLRGDAASQGSEAVTHPPAKPGALRREPPKAA